MTTPIAAGPLDRRVMPLPCPFCGSTDIGMIVGSTFRWRMMCCNGCGAQSGEVRAQTMGEGMRHDWELEAERAAIAEWNKRHNAALTGATPNGGASG